MKNDKIIKIIRVAKKYYESHMDQKIIAQEEDISVSTVSRMLKKAEEMGYIKITVEYPVLSNEELSASLKKKYNLEKVFLVPKLSDAPVAVQEDVCRAAAKDLSSYLNDGSIIGTAWGRTMKSFANYVSDLGVHNVKVVQINGKTNCQSRTRGSLCHSSTSRSRFCRDCRDAKKRKKYLCRTHISTRMPDCSLWSR